MIFLLGRYIKHLRGIMIAAGAMCATLAPMNVWAAEGGYTLLPFTKLHLKIVQFMPVTGAYRNWDAIGGDIEVSADGTVAVPVVGNISTSGLNAGQLGDQIARNLQAKLGLVDLPDASVSITGYPPIYLLGNVMTPGQYPFRPEMTVLQALALAGGQFRGSNRSDPTQTIKLQSDIQGAADDILRGKARIARLQAELSGAKEITFPAELKKSGPAADQFMEQEKIIFAARQNELGRQTAALTDLSNLYKAEIDVLNQKSKALGDQIVQTETQFTNIQGLVTKGVATVSRSSDIQRILAGLRSDRLDNTIAIMSARQGLSEATRNLAKIEDDQRSEVSLQLQAEQTNLERLDLNQTTSVLLLSQAIDMTAADQAAQKIASLGPAFTIMRNKDGKLAEIAADETTVLKPGDLVKVGVGSMSAPMNRVTSDGVESTVPMRPAS